jgi:uncharacterized protein with HEPN domain
MSRSIDYLRDILTEADFIERHTQNSSHDDFIADEVITRACARSLEIIGEAVKNPPAELKQKYPDVDWRNIARMRDRLIHHYFVIDYQIVHDVATNEVPVLKQQVEQILVDLEAEP